MAVSDKTLAEENRILREEIDQLREENRQLRRQLLPKDWEPPLELSLTPKERVILATLFKSPGTVSKESLMDTLYQFAHPEEVAQIKIVDVFVCKIRKKIAPYEMVIDTIWGEGYALTPASRDVLLNWGAELEDEAA